MTPQPARPWRDRLFLEEAEILHNDLLPGEHWLLRLAAPKIARQAQPGQFVHLTCPPPDHAQGLLRRPLSLLKANLEEGWIDLLYKVRGEGTGLLSRRKAGGTISVLGPAGNGFRPHPQRQRRLLLGGGVGMPPILFLAERLAHTPDGGKTLVLLGSETAFPFPARPSTLLLPEMPAGVIAAMPLLEDLEIPNRLSSSRDFPGCYQGFVTDLARLWLEKLDPALLTEVELFACGPEPMLRAVAALAEDFRLPAQLALEEHLACATGGCAGCVVPLSINGQRQMKRICVDGPVFDAGAVYPSAIHQTGNSATRPGGIRHDDTR